MRSVVLVVYRVVAYCRLWGYYSIHSVFLFYIVVVGVMFVVLVFPCGRCLVELVIVIYRQMWGHCCVGGVDVVLLFFVVIVVVVLIGIHLLSYLLVVVYWCGGLAAVYCCIVMLYHRVVLSPLIE